MCPARSPRYADDRAPRVRVPPGTAKSDKGGDEVHSVVVGDLGGERSGLGRGVYQSEPVPQPLDRGARRKDRSFEGVAEAAAPTRCRVLPEIPGNCREQPFGRRGGLSSEVHEKEASGAVGDLGIAGRVAAMTEERRLLVPGYPAHRDSPEHVARDAGRHDAISAGGRTHFAERLEGHVEQVAQFR